MLTPAIRRFGRELREFINSDPVFSLLEDGDWGAGGCWLLARALKEFLGPSAELWAVATETFPAEHVVVKDGDVFFDYNGASTEAEIISAFQADLENSGKTLIGLVPFTKALQRQVSKGEWPMRCPADLLKDLKAKLKERFGPHESD